MSVPGLLSIVLSIAAIAVSLDAMRIARKRDKLRTETGHAIPTIPRFATIGGCMAAAIRLDFLPGDRIGCAHCPWTGNGAPQFASHLLTCPDDEPRLQQEQRNAVINERNKEADQ